MLKTFQAIIHSKKIHTSIFLRAKFWSELRKVALHLRLDKDEKGNTVTLEIAVHINTKLL